jgi:hypothetical protein
MPNSFYEAHIALIKNWTMNIKHNFSIKGLQTNSMSCQKDHTP